jgi:hypothetical protein
VPKNYTAIGYYLHNLNPNSADSTAQSTLGFDNKTPTSTWLYDYATDLAAATPGRYVAPGGSGASETNPAKVIDWRLQLPQTFVSGSGTLVIRAAPANGDSTMHGTVNVYVNAVTVSGSTTTVSPLGSGSFDASAWGCAGFRRFGVTLPVTTTKLANNTWLDVRVEVASAAPMVFGYDTTTFPAMFVMPEK